MKTIHRAEVAIALLVLAAGPGAWPPPQLLAQVNQGQATAPKKAPDMPRPAQDKAVPEEFEGYDFGLVVDAMETSVSPLQQEMDRSFRVFTDAIQDAERLLDEGRTHDAVQKAASSIEGVLAVRDRVLGPMWEGQGVLGEQISRVRARLAQAVEAGARAGLTRLDERTETMLDSIARRISVEKDALRKQRLVGHYRIVRNLAQIRALALQLTPDQRTMWLSVLKVLEEAALAHEQVVTGSELLFAQFEATAANLKAYLTLLETVEGASRVMGVVRGVDEHRAGIATFAGSMRTLQDRLSGFNKSVEQALQGMMFELDAQIEAIASAGGEEAGGGLALAEDDELAERIARLSAETAQGAGGP